MLSWTLKPTIPYLATCPLCVIVQRVNLDLRKFDELDCIIQGIHFIDRHSPRCECYYFDNPENTEQCEKKPFDFRNPYPYIVVNIGSGVSILCVRSPTDYKRISGTRYSLYFFFGIFTLSFLSACYILFVCAHWQHSLQRGHYCCHLVYPAVLVACPVPSCHRASCAGCAIGQPRWSCCGPVCCVCGPVRCLQGKAPQYLVNCCHPTSDVASRQRLRSSSRRHLVGRRAFSVAGPMAWNALPDDLRDPSLSADNFRKKLRTHLFRNALGHLAH